MSTVQRDLTEEEFHASLIEDLERKEHILAGGGTKAVVSRMKREIAELTDILDEITRPTWAQNRKRMRYLEERVRLQNLKTYGVEDPTK